MRLWITGLAAVLASICATDGATADATDAAYLSAIENILTAHDTWMKAAAQAGLGNTVFFEVDSDLEVGDAAPNARATALCKQLGGYFVSFVLPHSVTVAGAAPVGLRSAQLGCRFYATPPH